MAVLITGTSYGQDITEPVPDNRKDKAVAMIAFSAVMTTCLYIDSRGGAIYPQPLLVLDVAILYRGIRLLNAYKREKSPRKHLIR